MTRSRANEIPTDSEQTKVTEDTGKPPMFSFAEAMANQSGPTLHIPSPPTRLQKLQTARQRIDDAIRHEEAYLRLIADGEAVNAEKALRMSCDAAGRAMTAIPVDAERWMKEELDRSVATIAKAMEEARRWSAQPVEGHCGITSPVSEASLGSPDRPNAKSVAWLPPTTGGGEDWFAKHRDTAIRPAESDIARLAALAKETIAARDAENARRAAAGIVSVEREAEIVALHVSHRVCRVHGQGQWKACRGSDELEFRCCGQGCREAHVVSLRVKALD